MKKTCKYCGVVDEAHVCPHRKVYKKYYPRTVTTAERHFRNKQAWIKKAREIKERDNYLCRACLEGIGCESHFNWDSLEVHHIVPLREDDKLGLVNSNLICLCRYHHEKAENGEIARDVLLDLAKIPPCL